ncbi:MAG: hypothetical protein SGI86_14905 [Deltaproteobacteria bacterium]|nr:hypothetical protein [Deltaproteobacteria bacterium]
MNTKSVAVALGAVLLGVAALATYEISDPDLGFHLATGRNILATGHWPDRNVLSFAEPNQPWVLQQGVPAVVFEWLWQKGGAVALITAKALMVALTFGLVFLATMALGVRPLLGAVVVLFGAWSCAFRFVERPLIFSNLMLALVIWSMVRAWRAPEGGRWRWLVAAQIATAIACNLHAGAVFSVLLLCLCCGCLWASPILHRQRLGSMALEPAGWRPAVAVAATLALALSLAGLALALYHPFPLRVLEIPFRMGADAFLAEHLIEFRPPWRFPFAVMKGYWIFLGAGLVIVILNVRRIALPLWAPVMVFAIFSLKFVRFADAYAIVAAPVIALGLEQLLARATLRSGLARLALAMAMLVMAFDNWSLRPLRLGFSSYGFGTAMMDRVAAWKLKGPAFVSDGWAGPFLARFYPEQRVYFFPAFDAFSQALYREYVDIRYGKPGWRQKLDQYGIELVVMKYTSPNERIYQGGADNLRQHLVRDADWRLVAFDDLGEIFVRAAGVNAAVAQTKGLAGLDPDRMRIVGKSDDVLRNLEQAESGLPASERLGMLKQLAAQSARAAAPTTP